jgi:hypothetical protein
MKANNMKKYSQLQKIISVLMSFILMIEFTGCYGTRIIPTSEIKVTDKYLIHSKNSTYSVDNVIISDGMLSGKLYSNIKNYGNADKFHMYLSSDLGLKINNDLISVPVSSITRIEQYVPERGKTTLFIVLFVAGFVAIGVGGALIINSLINSYVNTDETTFCSNW